jgi:hypothetical protein
MKTTKRIFSLLLSLALILSTFATTIITTSAKNGDKADIYITHYPRAEDANQNHWGHGEMQFMNGWTFEATSIFPAIALNSYAGKKAYCIEPGVSIWSGETLDEKDETYWDDLPDYNKTIDGFVSKRLIGRILQYGYTGNVDLSWRSTDAADRDKMGNMIATQMLVWETIVGERTEDFAHQNPPGGKDKIMDMIASNHPVRAEIMANYNRIVAAVQNHTKLPSFCTTTSGKAQTVDLTWDGSELFRRAHGQQRCARGLHVQRESLRRDLHEIGHHPENLQHHSTVRHGHHHRRAHE